jgi:hypothetical protein
MCRVCVCVCARVCVCVCVWRARSLSMLLEFGWGCVRVYLSLIGFYSLSMCVCQYRVRGSVRVYFSLLFTQDSLGLYHTLFISLSVSPYAHYVCVATHTYSSYLSLSLSVCTLRVCINTHVLFICTCVYQHTRKHVRVNKKDSSSSHWDLSQPRLETNL